MSQLKRINFQNFFWLLPFLVFFSTYILLHFWFKPETIAMPNLVGSNLTQGTKICSSAHLRPQIVQINIDQDLPQATITHQTPSAGSMIKKEQTIYIAITEKPALKKTPNCISMSRNEIKTMLANTDIRVKFYPIAYRYLTDHCFSQWPAPHTPLKSKTLICYVAQTPKKMVVWPDLKNKFFDKVASQLEEHGMQIQTNITPQANYTYVVYDQQPKAGSIVDISDTEHIVAYLYIKKSSEKNQVKR